MRFLALAVLSLLSFASARQVTGRTDADLLRRADAEVEAVVKRSPGAPVLRYSGMVRRDAGEVKQEKRQNVAVDMDNVNLIDAAIPVKGENGVITPIKKRQNVDVDLSQVNTIPESVPTSMQDGELSVIARRASHEHHVDVSRRENVPVNPRDVNWIGQRGSFPLDHEGECKEYMQQYLACIKTTKSTSTDCRHLSKAYLNCRMDRGLMERVSWEDLGFEEGGSPKAKAGHEPPPKQPKP
ncbi:cytochrome c oxidase assembly protein COX19 [Pseudohyphozyma bogoriensis]|nr:cytochrome c oxidase assembly protein COX19 [Pseudohyphozyma bogoriensis]